MKKIIYISLTVLYSSLITHYSFGQLVDKTPAAIPNAPGIFQTEPYEDPLVSGINRDASRATAYSFATIEDALENNREKVAAIYHSTGNGIFHLHLNRVMNLLTFIRVK